MKGLIALVLLSLHSLAEAQPPRRVFDPTHMRGRGEWVCSAQGMSTERPVLSRARSKVEAEFEAKMECQDVSKINNGWFCSSKQCEKDDSRDRDVDISIRVNRHGTSVEIVTSESARFFCKANAFGKEYYAKANTKLEAKVLASNVCADDRNGDAFFCDVNDYDCTEVRMEPERRGPFTGIFGSSHRDRPGVNDSDRNIRDDRRNDRRDYGRPNRPGARQQ